MKLFFVVACWAICFPLVAQNYLADHAEEVQELPNEPTEIQDYYQELIKKYGANDRYRASELALQKYGCNQEEYCAKLYNVLADEAVQMRNFGQAKEYYTEVLTTDFKPNRYTEGLVAEQAKLQALAALRNIAMEEKDYAKALELHYQYMDSLTLNWNEIAQRNQLENDKIEATCYQFLGKSEKAISCLSPYAFGIVNGFYGEIDKEAIDHLTELLRTKYPKKDYKRLLSTIGNQIYTEQKAGRVLFYLQVFENKIYFPNDSANFEENAALDETLLGQGIAHYQRKLFNSYFYQSLVVLRK